MPATRASVGCPAAAKFTRGKLSARRPSAAASVSARRPSTVYAASSARPPAVVILPGLGNATGDYDALKADLEKLQLTARVADVARIDWARNAAGVVDMNYWKGTLCPTPTVNWYLERITAAVEEAKEASGSDSVSIVAHSAGGWMTRVWMLERKKLDDVSMVLTLGSPLRPPPIAPGVIDQTRGILKYVDEFCPGPKNLQQAGSRFVCLAGTYLKGSANFRDTAAWAVGLGYQQVCGQAEVWGDGITPVDWAHLDGAENVVLDGVYHSPVGAGPERPWYGTPGTLEKWVHYLTSPAGEQAALAGSA